MSLLGERIEYDLAACERHGGREVPGGLGGAGQLLQQSHHVRTVLIAVLMHPVFIEVREQIAADEIERVLQLALREQPLELADVSPDVIGAGERDSLACGDQVAIGVDPQRAAQGRERAAQTGAGALVEHIGPEAGGKLAAGVGAALQGEDAEQGAGAAARGQLQTLAIELERHLSHQLDIQHRQSLCGFRGNSWSASMDSRAIRAGATGDWDSCSRRAQ